MPNDLAPHSVAVWLRWEIHERMNNGMLSGSPKDSQEYGGVIHCKDKVDAKIKIDEIIGKLKEEMYAKNENDSKKY